MPNKSLFLQCLVKQGWPQHCFDMPVQIIPGLWLSGIAFDNDICNWCHNNNFANMLNACGTYGRKMFYVTTPDKYNIGYLELELDDVPTQKLQPYYDKIYKFINESLDNKNKILVHCVWGQSRSVSCIIYFLMKKYNISYNAALEHIKQFRKCAEPNSGFEAQLKAL